MVIAVEDYFRNSWPLAEKTFKVIRRNKGYCWSFMLSPIAVILFMIVYQSIYEQYVIDNTFVDFPEIDVGGIPKCSGPRDCVSLGIYTIGTQEAWMTNIKEIIAKKNNLQPDVDVKMIGQGTPKDLQSYINANENKTQIFLVFCNTEWHVSLGDTQKEGEAGQPTDLNLNIPCQFEHMSGKKLVFYTLVMNATMGYTSPIFRSFLYPMAYNPVSVNAKKEVDEALILHFGKESKSDLDHKITDDFKYRVTSQGYPVSTQRIFENFDFFSMRGSFFFYMPIAVSFLIMVTELNYEKDKGIKLFMISAGMKSGEYWLGWLIVNAFLSMYISLSICIICMLLRVRLFVMVPFIYMMVLFFLSTFGMNSIAYLINTLSYSKSLRQASSYGFLLISFFFQIFFSTPNSTNVFYSQNYHSFSISVLRYVLRWYPGYNYTKLMADYVKVSGNAFDSASFKFTEGIPYTSSHFSNEIEGQLINGAEYRVPSAASTVLDLLSNIFAFVMIAWYCDNIMSSNQGIGKSFIFCCKKKEYVRSRRQADIYNELDESKHIDALERGQRVSESVIFSPQESKNRDFEARPRKDDGQLPSMSYEQGIGSSNQERVLSSNYYDTIKEGIVCVDITKTYVSHKACGFGKKEVAALKGVSLIAQKGDLVAILGQNGAGKTTLVNILTGYMAPSSGKGKLFEIELSDDLEKIRNVVSLCPQFDIFWDDLTVYEHMELIYYLKCLPRDAGKDYLSKHIANMNLNDKMHTPINQLSGGMRRRVNIGMSMIGDPKVLVLDEPTTGLDPVNQKEIVELIESIKHDKVIILVTHLMEEAEILSDKIAIMHDGNIIRIGNPMELKRELLHLYKINITYVKGLERDLKEKVARKCNVEESQFVHKGNYLSVLADESNIKAYLQLVKSGDLSDLVTNWDIATASLEELFLKLTKPEDGNQGH